MRINKELVINPIENGSNAKKTLEKFYIIIIGKGKLKFHY
jgi:hypothetical protein